MWEAHNMVTTANRKKNDKQRTEKEYNGNANANHAARPPDAKYRLETSL